ncbi:MAG: Gfo/Idh/MocA family oxidoreductase [Cyclobacteriaceae bacterium]|nr:Gfo/Idh/MocA family oxidoreductase [Cyclobacteriaceae bacterium]
MKNKINWGVLSVAKIAVNKVIPAMQQCKHANILGIASRDAAKANEAAAKLNIEKSYDSYEAMLADPDIDAIYIPLPNHLHFEWSMKCLDAGKHVLCEKPFVLSVEQLEQLRKKRDETGLKVAEAFMVRCHPRWHQVKKLIDEGKIGDLRAIQGSFTYYNMDPNNVRNAYTEGGGGIWDIGCYPVQVSRFIFGEDPVSVSGLVDNDPDFGVDRLATAWMKFPGGQSSFTVGTQTFRAQSMRFFGTEAWMEVDMPFNPPTDRPAKIIIHHEEDPEKKVEVIECEQVNQFTLQGDAFSRAILDDTEVPTPLEDTLGNTKTLLALFESAEKEKVVHV